MLLLRAQAVTSPGTGEREETTRPLDSLFLPQFSQQQRAQPAPLSWGHRAHRCPGQAGVGKRTEWTGLTTGLGVGSQAVRRPLHLGTQWGLGKTPAPSLLPLLIKLCSVNQETLPIAVAASSKQGKEREGEGEESAVAGGGKGTKATGEGEIGCFRKDRAVGGTNEVASPKSPLGACRS